ncbi:helix-turn-helix transcriptional regulator [Oscillospiraceae bacterium 38-13]
MLSRINEKREILPAAPDARVQSLLTLSILRLLPLSAGDRLTGYGQTGDDILCATVRGNLTISAYDHYVLLEAGQAYLLQHPGEYALQAVSDGQYILLQLQGELTSRLLADRLTKGSVLFPAGAAAVWEAASSLAALEEETGEVPGAEASSQAYAMLMKLRSAPGCRRPSPGSPLVEAAVAIIQEEFPFLEGVDDLAERLEVSSAHLGRVFTKKTGVSPGKYITRVRIEFAKQLLCHPDTTISYVAEASGFANANYFAKVFRRETGLSPSEYLQNVSSHSVGNIPHFGI